MPNRYDVSIDGTQYRLIRGENSYNQGASRAMVDFQEIETMEGTQLTSRNDVRSLYQTSWAGGSRWEKPLLSSESIDSYYESDDFDMLVEPGSLLPRENVASDSSTPESNYSKWVQVDYRTAYAVGEPGTTYHKILKWQDGVVTTLAQHSNIPNADTPLDMCWDEKDDTLYVVADAGYITYCTPGVGQGNVIAGYGYAGSAIFMHYGVLTLWASNALFEISDPLGSPTLTNIYHDGYGRDWLSTLDDSATNRFHFPWSSRLGLSTADGVYAVKNVPQSGTVLAYIYRIDRDAAGTVIGTPIATLDPGYVALDLFWSLGSLIVSATSDIGVLGANDASEPAPRTEFFHLTQNGLGSIGAPTGNNPSEFVFKMLFTSQRTIYIGGAQNVWAYDPVRGGLHMLHEDTALTSGHYHSGILASDGVHVFHGDAYSEQYKSLLPYAEDTSSANNAILDSNYFDFSLTGEQKYITEVTIMPTNIQSGETWEVFIEADDGSWASIATFTSGSTQKSILTNPVAGYRFRYRVQYSTTSTQTAPSKLKGVLFRALSGEMVPHWQLMIDGTEARNVENEIVRPEDVFDNMKTLRDTKTAVTFIDNYESEDRSSTSTYTVRVHSVDIIKEEPKEAVVQVVLVGT